MAPREFHFKTPDGVVIKTLELDDAGMTELQVGHNVGLEHAFAVLQVEGTVVEYIEVTPESTEEVPA